MPKPPVAPAGAPATARPVLSVVEPAPADERRWTAVSTLLIIGLSACLVWLIVDWARARPLPQAARIAATAAATAAPAAQAASVPTAPPPAAAPPTAAASAMTPSSPPASAEPMPSAANAPAHPLFDAAAPETASAPTAPPPPAASNVAGSWRLLGIVIGARPEAIVEHTETNELHFLHAGDALNGFTVQSMTEEQVVLHGEQGDITLSL